MCKCNGESVDHLLIHCPIASYLWSMILVLFRVSWVIPKSVVELWACWEGLFGCHRNGHTWMVIPHCLMWCIWRERNSWSFEDTEISMHNLKFFFFRTLLNWLPATRNLSLFCIIDLLDLCNFCNYCLTQYISCIIGWLIFSDLYNLITYQKRNFSFAHT